MVKFFEVTGGDRLGERGRASARGFMVVCNWVRVFRDKEMNRGMRIVPKLMMSGLGWDEM